MVDISSIIEGTVKFRDGKKVTRESRQGSTEGGGIKHQSNELAQSDSTASTMGGGGVDISVGGDVPFNGSNEKDYVEKLI